MGRKPKQEKRKIEVLVNGRLVTVTMRPPNGTKKSWYAYWNGLKAPKSTGHANFEDAVAAVNDMLGNGGQKSQFKDAVLSDEEFEEIQRRHYGKKQGAQAKERAQKSLGACLDAITAFREISGLKPITLATEDDCERFQDDALKLPKNWRSKYPKSKEEVSNLSANTVYKWSVALQAAFERANVNAGRKCVRGVVEARKLLQSNPWHKFQWIEGFEREIRQFDEQELASLLDYFESNWPGVTFATALAKTFLWSWGRRTEIVALRWNDAKIVGDERRGFERHFETVGKWAVDKWFRIPEALFEELLQLKTESPYVFSAYNRQLLRFHASSRRPWLANRLKTEFCPKDVGDWFYNRISDWSKSLPNGSACIHVFCKTSLQYARAGEDVNRRVAADARVGAGVLMTNYVKETDEEMRQRSNRTFARIVASLSPDVALRYGYKAVPVDPLQQRLNEAIACENWALANAITAELAKRDQQAG